MSAAAATAPNRGSWLRLALLAGMLLAVVLLPFLLWGAALDAAAPQWLELQGARWIIAALGIVLLVADVVLPIPASVVAMALCWRLGPLAGGACVVVGCLLAFTLGHLLGRLLPEARLRAWIGAALWDRVREPARQHALWWIIAARPLPLLAEVSAMLSGVFRLPPRRAFAHAAAASVAVGTLFGLSAWFGQGEPGMGAMLLAMFALPTLLWVAHWFVLRRVLRVGAASGPTEARDGSASNPPYPNPHPPTGRDIATPDVAINGPLPGHPGGPT